MFKSNSVSLHCPSGNSAVIDEIDSGTGERRMTTSTCEARLLRVGKSPGSGRSDRTLNPPSQYVRAARRCEFLLLPEFGVRNRSNAATHGQISQILAIAREDVK